jgi:hypothetical protein
MVDEVVLSHGAHIGADSLANLHTKLFQREAFPFGSGLHYLRINWVFVVVI